MCGLGITAEIFPEDRAGKLRAIHPGLGSLAIQSRDHRLVKTDIETDLCHIVLRSNLLQVEKGLSKLLKEMNRRMNGPLGQRHGLSAEVWV
jgi:hypothetical protein